MKNPANAGFGCIVFFRAIYSQRGKYRGKDERGGKEDTEQNGDGAHSYFVKKSYDRSARKNR